MMTALVQSEVTSQHAFKLRAKARPISKTEHLHKRMRMNVCLCVRAHCMSE